MDFGIRPFFETFVAYSNELNQIVGFALYFFTYSTWVIYYIMGGILTNKLVFILQKQGKSLYMEDIYVQPQQRRKGVGLSLLRSVSQVCLPQQSSSMKK